MVTTAPDSWSVVFDANSPYKGKVTAYDSPIYIADAALYLMAKKPELGITDPYALDETQYAAFLERSKTTHPLGRVGRAEERGDVLLPHRLHQRPLAIGW